MSGNLRDIAFKLSASSYISQNTMPLDEAIAEFKRAALADEDYPEDVYPIEGFEDCEIGDLFNYIQVEAEFYNTYLQRVLSKLQDTLSSKGVDLKGLDLIELVE